MSNIWINFIGVHIVSQLFFDVMFDFSDIDDCLRAMESPESTIRASAARSLAIFDDRKAFEALLMALEDENTTVRCNAVRALHNKPFPEAREYIIKCMREEPESQVRIRAAEVLSSFERCKESIEVLEDCLGDDSPLICIWSLYSLVVLGEKKYFKKLFEYTVDEDKKIRANVIGALGKIGDKKALDFLLGALQDRSWVVRYRAVQALGEMKASRAIPYLEKYLKDPETKVRIAAIKALEAYDDKKVARSILTALEDPDWEVRYTAIGLLEKIGAREMIPVLEKAFDREANPTVKLSIESLLDSLSLPQISS